MSEAEELDRLRAYVAAIEAAMILDAGESMLPEDRYAFRGPLGWIYTYASRDAALAAWRKAYKLDKPKEVTP